MGEMTGKTEIKTLAKLIANGHGGAVLDEFRDRARAAGVEGRAGGWIYLSSTAGKPIGQGWAAFATFLLDGLTPKARELRDAMAATPGTPERLNFRPASGLTNREATSGCTAYEAEAEGVKYRIVGNLIAGRMNGARAFRAYRVVGTNGHTLVPAGEGGESKTLKSAKRQAELDLVEVLRDRAAIDPVEAERKAVRDDAEALVADIAARRPEVAVAAGYEPEVEFPTPICPDAEAGKPHGAHRIEGTWREQCRGVEGEPAALTPDFDPGAGASAPDANRQQQAPRVRETAQERDERLAGEAGDSLLFGITASGARKIAAHLAARRPACVHPESGRVRSPDGRHPDACGDCNGPMPDGDRPSGIVVGRPAAPIREALDKVAAAAYDAVEQALAAAADVPQADPATDDDLDELLDRIVRRAQYVALRAVLSELDGWIETARHNCVEQEHGGASYHDDNRLCGKAFDVVDFRDMINGAADELRLPRPFRDDAS